MGCRVQANGYQISSRSCYAFVHRRAVDTADIEALAAGIRGGAGVDVNGDGTADAADHTALVKDILNTWIGDSNGDGEFNSSDFVAAFGDGGYEKGPKPAAVPEPAAGVMLLIGVALAGFAVRVRRRRRL